jgi:hypothetical protein
MCSHNHHIFANCNFQWHTHKDRGIILSDMPAMYSSPLGPNHHISPPAPTRLFSLSKDRAVLQKWTSLQRYMGAWGGRCFKAFQPTSAGGLDNKFLPALRHHHNHLNNNRNHNRKISTASLHSTQYETGTISQFSRGPNSTFPLKEPYLCDSRVHATLGKFDFESTSDLMT